MEFQDDLDLLASAGFSRRRSSALSLPLSPFSSDGVGGKRKSLDRRRGMMQEVSVYRVLMMGGNKVGKTSIISQFLYDKFQSGYKPTLEEMYKGDFEIGNRKVSLNIEDMGGSFAFDFPAMVEVSLSSADAVILVYAVDDQESFEQVAILRDLVMKSRGPDIPIVVEGNKIVLERKVEEMTIAELVVKCDWENGYVECSAKLNENIEEIFMELFNQAKIDVDIIPSCFSTHTSALVLKRRKSSPVDPVFNRGVVMEEKKKETGRRTSISMLFNKFNI